MSPEPARRGRPRSEAVERAIIEAVVQLLEDGVPAHAVSVERVARTAGVGKAAVYRRWPGKDALLLDVLRTLEEPPYEGPADGPVRDVLVGILEWQRRIGLAKRNSTLLRTMAGHVHNHPELWETYHKTVIERRRKLLHDVLRRGVERGELRDDVSVPVLADLFAGPMLSRVALRVWDELPEELPTQIVDAVLAGVRAP